MNWLCVRLPDGTAAQGAALFLFSLGEKFISKVPKIHMGKQCYVKFITLYVWKKYTQYMYFLLTMKQKFTTLRRFTESVIFYVVTTW